MFSKILKNLHAFPQTLLGKLWGFIFYLSKQIPGNSAGIVGGKGAKVLLPQDNDKEEPDSANKVIKNVPWNVLHKWKTSRNLFIYLHESDEQEEGVGGPSDLFIQEAGQKGEHSILGSTVKRKETKHFDVFMFNAYNRMHFYFTIITQETFSPALKSKRSHKFSPSSSKIVARNPFTPTSQSTLLIR